MPWEPDWETALRLAWITAALSFLVAVVSAIGELLGWWDLVGELGIGFGTTVTLILTVLAAFFSAGRQQVAEVGQAVQDHGEMLEANGETLVANGETLGDVHRAIAGQDGMLDELDVIQLELDTQTGVLRQQLDVLDRIQEGFGSEG